MVARRRRGLAVALAATLLVTLTAGSCRPQSSAQPEQTPGDDVSYEDVGPAPNSSDDPKDRQNVVNAPKGTAARGVEFADANTGYALFSSCASGRSCDVGLVFTLDAGASWVARPLPFDDATDVDMRLGRGNVLIIKAAPAGYFISKDSGRTFDKRPITPPPVELALADPQYSVGCQNPVDTGCGDPQPWITGDDGARRPLPTRPAGKHDYSGLAAAADGTLWLSAVADDPAAPGRTAVTVWSSPDGGKTWKAQGVARAPDQRKEVRPVVSPDGTDIWLVGPHYAARRVPSATDGWQEATAMREVNEVFSAEVLPGGVLLVASSSGVLMLDLTQRLKDPGAATAFRLRRIAPDTIVGYPAQAGGEIWLCTVKQKVCDWSHIAVSAR